MKRMWMNREYISKITTTIIGGLYAFLGFIGDHHAGITFVPSIWKIGNLLLLPCFHNSLPSFLLTKNAQ